MKRFITLVLDGFGVGAMDDVTRSRPQDQGAHTLKHIIEAHKDIHIDNLRKIGAEEYFVAGKYNPKSYHGCQVSFGKNNLAHFGADSYIGHQEIAGSKPQKPIRQFVREKAEEIMKTLEHEGLQCAFKNKIIVVNEHIAIADNIETDYGLNINVVGSLDHYSFALIERIGKIVRNTVQVGRVITMGGTQLTQKDFYRCFASKKRNGYTAWGIDIPALQIYNEDYHVVHMGYGVDPETQIPQILTKNNIPVVLIGKTADVIVAKNAQYYPQVHTQDILELLLKKLDTTNHGFIFANIQETDLSGHSQDVTKYKNHLEMIDAYLPRILSRLHADDVFLITGDHGNDPTIGHSNHTRERTPVMMFSKQFPARDLGIRSTLADVGASVADYFHVTKPQSGKSLFIV